ncbi:unnamed protein product [Phaeothamnion confervicola]
MEAPPRLGERWTIRLPKQIDDDLPLPTRLAEISGLEAAEWREVLTKVRQGIEDRASCIPCTSAAYLCCLCTGGLSLLEYHRQRNEASEGLAKMLGHLNANLEARGKRVRLELRRGSCNSADVTVEFWPAGQGREDKL